MQAADTVAEPAMMVVERWVQDGTPEGLVEHTRAGPEAVEESTEGSKARSASRTRGAGKPPVADTRALQTPLQLPSREPALQGRPR